MLKEKVYSILISLLLATVGICAQTPTATLSGVVRDEQKGGIPKATVVVLALAGIAGGRAGAVHLIGLGLLALMVISLAASLKSARKPERSEVIEHG